MMDMRKKNDEDTINFNLEKNTETPNTKENEKKNNKILKFIIIICCIILLYFILLKTGVIKIIFIDLEKYLENLYKKHSVIVLFIIFLLLTVVSIFSLPSHMIISILTSLIIKNIWISFLFLTLFSVIDSCLIFLLVKFFLHNYLLGEYHDNVYVKIFKTESKKNPFKVAFLCRIIFVASGFKDYILALIDNPFKSFITSAICVHGFFVILFVLIAEKITEMKSFFENKDNWESKPLIDKIEFVVVFLLILFTFIFTIFLGWWVSKKLKQKNQDREMLSTSNQLEIDDIETKINK